jgi:chromosome transmission fidelity protein 18
LATFESRKTTGGPPAPVRYAVRQVLEQEYRRDALRIRSANRLARGTGPNRLDALGTEHDDKENTDAAAKKKHIGTIGGKRDFFGRLVNEARPGSAGKGMESTASKAVKKAEEKVWVSFHEGYSNAVRKPITLKEFLDSF